MMNRFQLEEQLQQADAMIRDGKTAEAATLLENMISEEPGFGKAYNHLGFIYETKYQDFSNAEKYYKLALQFAPDYSAPYYNYAVLLSTLKRWDDLTALLEKAKTLPNINTHTIANEYAMMYEIKGELDKAIDHYRLCVQNSFDNTQIDNAMNSIERCKKKKEVLVPPMAPGRISD